MASDLSDGVGRRVRTLRKLQGLTQELLAQRMCMSLSLVKQVERGAVPASPTFTNAAARVLKVTTADLYGQPDPRFGEERRDIAELETAVLAGWALADDGPLPDLDQLQTELRQVLRCKRQAQYAQCSTLLPPLLAGLHTYVEQAPEGHLRDLGNQALGQAYDFAMITLYRLGSPLAGMAAERGVEAGTRGGDPNLRAFLQGERALPLIHRGAFAAADRVLRRSLAEIEDQPHSPRSHTVKGFLHLRSAILDARAGHGQSADAHLTEAREHASTLPEVSDLFGAAFCLPNVMIHSVSAAVELGNGTLALSRNQPLATGILPSRQAHHRIDLARAWLLHGDRAKAFDSLGEARRLGAQLTRYHPQVHEMLVVLADSDRRRSDTLAGFARWAGVRL